MAKGEINQLNLFQAIQKSWWMDTSADMENWSEDNPAWGQCAVTALTVQDFLGGEILRLDLTKHPDPKVAVMRSHYFNRINGEMLDVSSDQFGDINRFYAFRSSNGIIVRNRHYFLKNQDTRSRYAHLRYNVAKLLGKNSPLFGDCIYVYCLANAMLSDCQKSRFGCVVKYCDQIVTVTFNRILGCMKDWAEPQCIRLNIQSRTQSMIGCCSHAEEEALVQVRDLKLNPSECDFYVAGFRSSGLAAILPEKRFSCIRCATNFYLHGVGRIFVPVKDRWESMTAEEAIQSAKKYALGEKRIL